MTGFRWLIDQFTQLPRWERLGNIVMVGIVLFSVLLLSLWPVKEITAEEKNELDRMQLALENKLEKAREIEERERIKRFSVYKNSYKGDSAFLIPDINRASFNDLVKCGLSRYVARNILRYIEKGGKIETVEDAKKLYGMTPEMLDHLLAHTRLDSARKKSVIKKEPVMIDLNTADSLQLVSVRGIGGKTAQRILVFRQQIGLFHSISQLDEIKGIKPESLELIKQQVTANGFKPFIHINSISEKDLFKHNYFRKDRLAKTLVAYRDMHGPFGNADDLKKCRLVTDEVLNHILPYIVFD